MLRTRRTTAWRSSCKEETERCQAQSVSCSVCCRLYVGRRWRSAHCPLLFKLCVLRYYCRSIVGAGVVRLCDSGVPLVLVGRFVSRASLHYLLSVPVPLFIQLSFLRL